MHVLLLASFILQVPAAGAADSARVRVLLTHGLTELNQVVGPADRALTRRFLDQLRVWSMPDSARSLAARVEASRVQVVPAGSGPRTSTRVSDPNRFLAGERFDAQYRREQATRTERAVQSVLNAGVANDLEAALAEALQAAQDTAGLLLRAARTVQERMPFWLSPYSSRPPRDSVLRIASILYEQTVRGSERLAPVQRDSVRLGAQALLAQTSGERALHAASADFSLPRFRDRALAEALRALAEIDADRAERLAGELRAADTRDLVFVELTMRAMAGGRLNAASALAGRLVEAPARARAQLLVANAEFGARRVEAARLRISALLPALDPSWRCAAPCDVPPDPKRHNLTMRFERILAADVVRLAQRLGMDTGLERWAATRASPELRAAAWLLQAEAIAQEQLNHWADYRQQP